MKYFYSNGKLLLTAEYTVLDGAIALALPTKFGQDLSVTKIEEQKLIWQSFTYQNNLWLEVVFDLKKQRIINSTYYSKAEKKDQNFAEILWNILQQTQLLNADFLREKNGFLVKTKLTFSQSWGLGSSSTLLNNIANWAKVNPYKLLENTFGGSAYDIACAQNNKPILYQKKNNEPFVTIVDFNPNFTENLFFVYLNEKQNSREGIALYQKNKNKTGREIERISKISEEIIKAKALTDFEKLLEEHEKITAKITGQKTIKSSLFTDYFGTIKSLGAWGGDFVLATGDERSKPYFKAKGFPTVLSFKEMIL